MAYRTRARETWVSIKPLLTYAYAIVAIGVVGGVLVSSYTITIEALIEGRSLHWWFRTDYCPEPDMVCGGMAWAGIAAGQVLLPIGAILFYIVSTE